MRTFVISTIVALLFGGACKKHPAEKAENEMKKAQERVEEKAEDLRDEQKDVQKKAEDLADEQRDVAEKRGDLALAEAELAAAKDKLATETKAMMARIEGKLLTLEAKADAKAKETAAELRIRKNELSAKLERIGDYTAASWNEFKAEVTEAFGKLEKDLDDKLD